MNFAKFLHAPILRNTSGQLLLGTAQKIKFSIKNFISNCDQIRSFHTETSPLICSVNQFTDFYMIRTSVMKVLL